MKWPSYHNFCGYWPHWELTHMYTSKWKSSCLYRQWLFHWCRITTGTINIPIPYISWSSCCMRLVLHKYNPADDLLSGFTLLCRNSPYLLRELVSLLSCERWWNTLEWAACNGWQHERLMSLAPAGGESSRLPHRGLLSLSKHVYLGYRMAIYTRLEILSSTCLSVKSIQMDIFRQQIT